MGKNYGESLDVIVRNPRPDAADASFSYAGNVKCPGPHRAPSDFNTPSPYSTDATFSNFSHSSFTPSELGFDNGGMSELTSSFAEDAFKSEQHEALTGDSLFSPYLFYRPYSSLGNSAYQTPLWLDPVYYDSTFEPFGLGIRPFGPPGFEPDEHLFYNETPIDLNSAILDPATISRADVHVDRPLSHSKLQAARSIKTLSDPTYHMGQAHFPAQVTDHSRYLQDVAPYRAITSGIDGVKSENKAPTRIPQLNYSPKVTAMAWDSHEKRKFGFNTMLEGNSNRHRDHNHPDFQEKYDYGSSSSGIFEGHSQQASSFAMAESVSSQSLARSLNDHEKHIVLQMKAKDINQWLSPAQDIIGDSESPEQSQRNWETMLSGGESDFHDPHKIVPHVWGMIDAEEGMVTLPVSDAASIRENQLKEGQTYFDFNASGMNEEDKEMIIQPRQWNEMPVYPYSILRAMQPPTSNAAIAKFDDLADHFSYVSRTATLGSRRGSAINLTDIESIHNGSFLKRLSISNAKEQPASLASHFKDSFDQLTTMVRRKSAKGKLKRSLGDQDSLTSPRLNNNVGGSYSTLPRPGTVSRLTTKPVKNPLKSILSSIHHARNKIEPTEGSAIVDLWRKSGGPPVPTLAQKTRLAYSTEVYPRNEGQHDDDDDDSDQYDDDTDEEDDCLLHSGEAMDIDQQASPSTPDFIGFQEHLQRLNPKLKLTYLIERLARHQAARYERLVGLRIKHKTAISDGKCTSQSHCMAQDSTALPFDPNRGNHNVDSGYWASGFEAKITPGDFPRGVPMPSASILPAKFECQLCFRVTRILKPSSWTKHVYEDIRPFTCTFSSCRRLEPFKRMADWVQHENEEHRHLEWWRCDVDDCTCMFFRMGEFVEHFLLKHETPELQTGTRRWDYDPLGAALRKCRHETGEKSENEACKFCGLVFTTWKKLIAHVAAHLKQTSLSILEVVDRQLVCSNTFITPVSSIWHSPSQPLQQISNNLYRSTTHKQTVWSPDVNQDAAFRLPPQSSYGMISNPNIIGFSSFAQAVSNENSDPRSYTEQTTVNQSMASSTIPRAITMSKAYPESFLNSSSRSVEDPAIIDPMHYSSSTRERSPSRGYLNRLTAATLRQENDIRPSEDDIKTLGKASPYPYSSPSQDNEHESTYETETEMNEDGCPSAISPFDSLLCSDFSDRKQMLFIEIMRVFWNVYNKNGLSIVPTRIKSMATCMAGGSGSNSSTQPQSTSTAVTSSGMSDSLRTSVKRKRSQGDDDNDEFPPGDQNQGSKQPNGHTAPAVDERSGIKFSCPFRKRNPQKYNIHHPFWKGCAISSFDSVGRTKKHKAAIQCVRCWIFFESHEHLDLHLSAINICEVRPGQAIEGITLDMISRLRSRKKSSIDQTEEARWRNMYRIIFPREEIPSPFFEPVQDSVAQFPESTGFLFVEEFIRQHLPPFLTRRLERIIHGIDLYGTPDEQRHILGHFATLMPRLVDEAVDDASTAYQQRISGDNALSNILPTPSSSHSYDSSQTPLATVSRTTCHATSQLENQFMSASLPIEPPPFDYSQHINHQASEPELNIPQTKGVQDIDGTRHCQSTEAIDTRNSPDATLESADFKTSDDIFTHLQDNGDFLQQDSMVEFPPFDWEAAFGEHNENNEGRN